MRKVEIAAEQENNALLKEERQKFNETMENMDEY